ncbi:hypothetical protein [Flaviaesturariibacter terrae]
MNVLRGALFLALTCFVPACRSTHVTTTWTAPEHTAKTYHKIMVAGIIRESDRSLRAAMEEHLTGDLTSRGYTAFSALQHYGPGRFKGLSEQESAALLKADGVDAVMTIVLLDKKQERYYVPSQVTYTPYGRYQNRVWSYYGILYDRIETPGYFTESTRYFWESNFYDLADNKLLYSVQTESFDPPSTQSAAHEYGKLIVASLMKSGVLAPAAAAAH